MTVETGTPYQGDVRAAVLEAPRRIRLQEFPRPAIGRDAGLLFVEAAGVCGSDPHFYNGAIPLPKILGHEIIGRIEAVGDIAAARWKVHAGDRVAVEASISCGVCPECLEGRFQSCAAQIGYGTHTRSDQPPHLWGGFAERMYLAPGSVVNRVPDGVAADTAAAWVSPLSNGIEWTGAGGVEIGHVVVIQGVGPQGLSCIVAAKERGAALIVASGLERDRARREAALRLGAHRVVVVERESLVDVVRELSHGAMADVAIDVSGNATAAPICVDLVRPYGTIVAGSMTGAMSERTLMPLNQMVMKSVRWQGVLANRGRAVREALRVLASGRYDFRALITHQFGLDDTDLAIRTVAGEVPGEYPIKAVIYPNGVVQSV
ncbi:MAG: alcohol dehydrogenase catalytic domain-containing protein [Candidatus Binatia bacterium]